MNKHMTQLPLSEEQRVKILEMANTLFPEDLFTFDNDAGEDGFIDRNFHDTKSRDVKELIWQDEGSHFHWFEFAMCHLTGKLGFLQREGKIPLDDGEGRADIWWRIYTHLNTGMYHGYKKHPVDYLYEKFKQLK